MKITSVLLLAAMLAAASPVRAETIDLTKVSCQDFFGKTGEKNLAMALAWLNAFFSDDDAPQIIEFEKIDQQGKRLAEECKKNPSQPLSLVAEQIYKN